MNMINFNKHIPLKKYGQNFLINQNIIQEIITKINPKFEETLLEIGPGLGSLTKPICALLKELIVIEVDKNLLNLLKKYSFYRKLNIFSENALFFNYTNLFKKNNKLIRIFGNLPYNISTSLIIYLFKHIKIIQDMNFMLQKEVAERLIATPGKKSYGRLSVIAQYYCDIKILLKAAPEDFWPRPKVHSVFVSLKPHSDFFYFLYDVNVLSIVTKLAFQKRRKILRHSLNRFFSEKSLIKLEIDPTLRAENLSVFQYCQLSNYLYKKKYIKK